jgi:hypothetical protein
VPLALNSLYSLITNDEMVSDEEDQEEPVQQPRPLRDFEIKTL